MSDLKVRPPKEQMKKDEGARRSPPSREGGYSSRAGFFAGARSEEFLQGLKAP